jgi:primosomal protein N' (replication factor Y)
VDGAILHDLLGGALGPRRSHFEAVARALEKGRQALIMLPEIALTSQFMDRFTRRFGCPPVEWHSALSSAERGRAWRAVATGEARVVVGARSALFLPFKDLGLIVVDEETTRATSRTTACTIRRDMAVVRGNLGGFGDPRRRRRRREPRECAHRALSARCRGAWRHCPT